MKKKILLVISCVLIIYLIIFPMRTPEMAVRRDMFIRNPVKAITSKVNEAKIKNDPRYGDLYIVLEADRPFIYVKKYVIGWYVTSSGNGP